MRTHTIALALSSASLATAQVKTTHCNGQKYVYEELSGFGYIPSDAYDKYGDTIGGIGSAIAIPKSTWKKTETGYAGILWAQPDRGWNTEGTLNYQARHHKFVVTLDIMDNATVKNPSGPNVHFTYLDTVLYTDPSGTPTTGLDADDTGAASFKGFPQLPIATYTGNGYGGSGPGGKRVPMDNEGLVVNSDGTWWTSDEYGPYVYLFSKEGQMVKAIRPPQAYIPMRNGSESFSADSPTIYSNESDDVSPADPQSGRENNHGFEGLSVSPDGKTLYVLLQAALIQDGGASSSTDRYTRFLIYDISSATPKFKAEYVVELPQYDDGHTAAQSEVHYLSDTQFLILARDSNSGYGQSETKSVYRHADIFDISSATNIKGKYDGATGAVAPDGTLDSSVTAAEYCPFINYNINSQLRRFGVHNGGASNPNLLNEKWESFAFVPVNGDGSDGEYFIFSMSDNDFITQNGHLNFGTYPYSDDSGYNLDSQTLVFKVQLPKSATPI